MTQDDILELVKSRTMVTVPEIGAHFGVTRCAARHHMDKLFYTGRLREVRDTVGNRPAVYALAVDGHADKVATHHGVSLPRAPWEARP